MDSAADVLRLVISDIIKNRCDDSKDAADRAVCDVRRIGNEGRGDQGGDHQKEHEGGHIVCDNRSFLGGYRFAVLAEKDHHDRNGGQSAELHRKEHAGLSIHPEEIHEVHVGVVAEHDGSRIAHERCGALQVGGDRNGNDHGNGIDVQLLAYCKSDRRDHEHGSDVVDKGGDEARKERHADRDPHDVGTLIEQNVCHQVGHPGRDKEVHEDHSAGDHKKDVPVDHGEKARKGKDPCDQKDQSGAQRIVGAIFGLCDHEHIH